MQYKYMRFNNLQVFYIKFEVIIMANIFNFKVDLLTSDLFSVKVLNFITPHQT